MPFTVKLIVFWLVLLTALWLLRRFPESRISRLAFSWHGPTPIAGELKSAFLVRQSLHMLVWATQVLAVFCGVWLLAAYLHNGDSPTMFVVLWIALPLLGATFLLAAILHACSALKAKWLGPNPIYVPHGGVHEA